MKLKGRYKPNTLLEVFIIRVLFSFFSSDPRNFKLEGIIYLVHALKFPLPTNMITNKKSYNLMLIFFIVRREPSESQTCLTLSMMGGGGGIPDGRRQCGFHKSESIGGQSLMVGKSHPR